MYLNWFAFLSVKIDFLVLCFGYIVVNHPDTNPTGHGQNFSERLYYIKLSDAQSARLNLCCIEVMRELENDQHVSLEAKVFRFPFIFFNLSGFSTLLVTTCLLRGLFT